MQRGKWGITRDESGRLAFLMEWPWYWRYPSGVAIAAGTVLLALSMEGQKPDWLLWGIVVGGVLTALAVMYEFGCLAMVVALFGGIWLIADAYFPDVRIPLRLELGLVAAGACYAWYKGNQALELAEKNRKSIEMMWQRLNSIDESMEAATGRLHAEMFHLKNKIRSLDG